MVEEKLKCKNKPNYIQVAKNKHEQSIIEMVTYLLQSLIQSEYSQQFVPIMMSLKQETQVVLAKMVQEESTYQEASNAQDIVEKFEELELENSKLQQQIQAMKLHEKQQQQKYAETIEFMQTEIDTQAKQIQQAAEDLNQLYEFAQVSSIADVVELIGHKNELINQTQEIVKQLKNDLKQEKEVHEDIVRELRSTNEHSQRKILQYAKLDKYVESLKNQLTEALQEQKKHSESMKASQKIKDENGELAQKVAQLQQKVDAFK